MRRLPLFLFCALLVACQPPAAEPGPVQEAGEGGAMLVLESDPEMAAAIEQARASLDEAIAAVPNRDEGHLDVLVKAGFATPDDGTEYLWLVVEGYDDGVFHTWVGNVPAYTDEVAYDDEIDITAEQISDWMVVEDGVMRGGYTTRLIVARMTDEERAAFEAEAPFSLGETP